MKRLNSSQQAARILARSLLFAVALALTGSAVIPGETTAAAAQPYLFNDVHLHLTNYVQEGPSMQQVLKLMGDRVGRAAIFGIPLQQQWSHRVSGDQAPTYYLDTDADLYYYSFTDAHIAQSYRSLSKEQQARIDPMITGFNPADMYAADHIRRVLLAFPGVFSGIGEFTIHKEFVSAKVAGDVPSLTDPALDRILEFAGEVGLVVLIHNDMDVPFPRKGAPPAYLAGMKALVKRHPRTTVIWAHVGVGRVVRPVEHQAQIVEEMLKDPNLKNLYFDISWSEVAKYLVSTPETIRRAAQVLNAYPDRVLFGSDEVAPRTETDYFRVYEQYAPLWRALTADASRKVRLENYERIFDHARQRVRAWEKAHVK